MSFFKKASLAVSVLALSTAANAELVAMDEASMSAATGQAGIDIDINLGSTTTGIEVGAVTWTDTDTGGAVAISGIDIGSATGTDLILNNTIDVTADGELVIGTSDITGLYVGITSVDTVADSASVNDLSTNLASDVNLYLNTTGSTITVSDNASSETQIVLSGGTVEILSGTDLDNADGDNDTATGTEDSNLDLFGSAVTVDGIKAYNGSEGTGISTEATLTFNNNGLVISDFDLTGTIELGAVGLGGSSIGSLAITDLTMASDATITISGHN